MLYAHSHYCIFRVRLRQTVVLLHRDRKIPISALTQSTAESADRCGECESALMRAAAAEVCNAKNIKFPISVETRPSATAASVKCSLCESVLLGKFFVSLEHFSGHTEFLKQMRRQTDRQPERREINVSEFFRQNLKKMIEVLLAFHPYDFLLIKVKI